MRAQAPVYPGVEPGTDRRLWFLTRYRDVQRALRRPELSRQYDRLPAELAAPHRRARNDVLAGLGLSRHLLNLDPPDHTRLRQLMSTAFSPRTVAALAPRIRRVAGELVGAIPVTGEVDLIETLALPLPVIVIAELLGVPIHDRTQFREWVEQMLRGSSVSSHDSGTKFVAYLTEQIERRRARPGDDLLSRLVQVELAGDRLSRTELLSCAFLLLVAGHETTVNLVGNGVLELLRRPWLLATLQQRPAGLGRAIEELLRINGPVEASTVRFTLAEVDFDGVVVPRGEAVVPVLLAANRDPTVFPSPDRLDLDRHPNRHLAFGHGSHFCLGAPLARLEGSLAIGALLQRFPDLSLATGPDRLEWSNRFPLRGLRRLPVMTGEARDAVRR
jgi:cytochrome P450